MLAQTAPATTNSTTLVVIVIAILVLIAVVAFVASKRRTAALHQRFGREYERTVATAGSRERAEKELAARETRVRKLHIQPLAPGARDRYADEWRNVQATFVDQPEEAVRSADRLVTNVMRDRGYPVDDAAQRVDDLSVEHAGVIDNYRTARAISLLNDQGRATTEDLRNAMVSYRSLFSGLLETAPGGDGRTPVAATQRKA